MSCGKKRVFLEKIIRLRSKKVERHQKNLRVTRNLIYVNCLLNSNDANISNKKKLCLIFLEQIKDLKEIKTKIIKFSEIQN